MTLHVPCALLQSNSILTQRNLSVFVRVENGTESFVVQPETSTVSPLLIPSQPHQTLCSPQNTFTVFPAVIETVSGCVPWWILVVSVVLGIAFLVLGIFIVACVRPSPLFTSLPDPLTPLPPLPYLSPPLLPSSSPHPLSPPPLTPSPITSSLSSPPHPTFAGVCV